MGGEGFFEDVFFLEVFGADIGGDGEGQLHEVVVQEGDADFLGD
jgi:hypothetical protein